MVMNTTPTPPLPKVGGVSYSVSKELRRYLVARLRPCIMTSPPSHPLPLSPFPLPPPPQTHSVKMDDTPIPEYLIDMLKEAGEIDENGKPLNDFFDPDDDDTFGSKRMKEHNAGVEVPNEGCEG